MCFSKGLSEELLIIYYFVNSLDEAKCERVMN